MIIYKITNAINNKIYVGKTTKSLARRFAQHLSLARQGRGYAIHQAIRKHGESAFDIVELCICSNEEEFHRVETSYIEDLDTMCPNGYNKTFGGLGETRTKESYSKQSSKMKGRVITWGDKISDSLKNTEWKHPMCGKQYRDTSFFTGNNQAGKWNKLLKGHNVRCIEDNIVFESMNEASSFYNVGSSTIKRALKKRSGFVKKINKTFITA